MDSFSIIQSGRHAGSIMNPLGVRADSQLVQLGEEVKGGMERYTGFHTKLQQVYEKARGLETRIGTAQRSLAARAQKIKTMHPVKAFFFKNSGKKEESKIRAQLKADRQMKEALFGVAKDFKGNMDEELKSMHSKENQISISQGRGTVTGVTDRYFVDTKLEIYDFFFEAVFAREIAAE